MRALLDVNVLIALLDASHGGRLINFDQGIPLSAVPGARPEHMIKL